ncbi:unnamed protein product [Dicrocoelium dendriticum]|nr:unnamed protein product [Dicrocoelium dendriticum]
MRTGEALKFHHPDDAIPIDDGKTGYWWCSTTPDFDRDGLWTRCRPQHAYMLPCHFPTRLSSSIPVGGIVRGLDRECQPIGGNWLCRTELNQLRECPKQRDIRSENVEQQTEGGNDPGYPCYFPFQATVPILSANGNWVGKPSKRNLTHCLPGIEKSEFHPEFIFPPWIGYWCSTTANFDADHLWTRCSIHAAEKNALFAHTIFQSGQTLAHLWSYIHWLNWLSNSESSKLDPSTLAFSTEFENALKELNLYRTQWEIAHSTEDNVELQWWTWLAPFWWTSYRLNHTNRLDGLLRHSTQTNEESNPLSKGFQLPQWVESWTSGVSWSNSGKEMNARWKKLKLIVSSQWYKSWFTAYLLGILTAVGVIVTMHLLFFAGIERRKREAVFQIMCKDRGKNPKQYDNVTGVPQDGTLPGYPYFSRPGICSDELDAGVGSQPSGQTRPNSYSSQSCFFHPFCHAEETDQHKTDCIKVMNIVLENSDNEGVNCQTNINTDRSSAVHFPCWSCTKYATCVWHYLSIREALDRVHGDLRKNEMCNSVTWQHLCDLIWKHRQPTLTNCEFCRSMIDSTYEVPERDEECPRELTCPNRVTEPCVEPSAPPPSYDQVAK